MAFYYLNSDNQPVGPMELGAIRKLAEAGIVPPEVLVCEAGGQDWTPLSQRQESTARAETAKPPRTPPPSQRPQPAAQAPEPAGGSPAPAPQDWFPLASLVAGIVAMVALCVPLLSFLIGGGALALGILGYRLPEPKSRPFAIAGLSTGALALIVSAGIMLSGAGGGTSRNPEAAAIERVLEKSAKVAQAAKTKFPQDSNARFSYFARELQKIDTRACPSDFRVAYQDHIQAWNTAIPYFASDNFLTSVLEGFVGGLIDDFSGVGFANYQAQLAAHDIQETYHATNRIAVAHGARIPTR